MPTTPSTNGSGIAPGTNSSSMPLPVRRGTVLPSSVVMTSTLMQSPRRTGRGGASSKAAWASRKSAIRASTRPSVTSIRSISTSTGP